MRLLHTCASALLVASVLVGQTGQPGGPPKATKKEAESKTESKQDPAKESEATDKASRIEERAKRMRQEFGGGKKVKSHVRVQVRLNNGNRLRGVVKDGRLVERVTGLRFETAHAADRGAGIRIWYSGGTRNYVFVPFSELKNYTVLQRLTTEQLAELEAEMAMKEDRERRGGFQRGGDPNRASGTPARPEGEGRPQAGGATGSNGQPANGQSQGATPAGPGAAGVQTQASQIGSAKPSAKGSTGNGPGATGVAKSVTSGTGSTGSATTGAGTGAGASEAQQDAHRKWFQLLQDYPPAQGWNEAKRTEIQTRFNRIGAAPTEKENAFVENFAEWQKAVKHFAADTGTSDVDGSQDTGRKKTRRELRQERREKRRKR